MHQSCKLFLKITYSTLPDSCLHKYIAQQFDIETETDVDITCKKTGEPHDTCYWLLVDMWIRVYGEHSQKVQTSLGSSVKDLIVELNYSHISTLLSPGPVEGADQYLMVWY